MKQEQYSFVYKVYPAADVLSAEDAQLLAAARAATADSYAPYSHFRVGAAALLQDGTIVKGTNQENASYPVGICAERVLLSAISSLQPKGVIQTIAISYFNEQGASNHPISPCGICRQSLVEYEQRQQQPIRLLLSGTEGPVYVIERAGLLLPLGFSANDM